MTQEQIREAAEEFFVNAKGQLYFGDMGDIEILTALLERIHAAGKEVALQGVPAAIAAARKNGYAAGKADAERERSAAGHRHCSCVLKAIENEEKPTKEGGG